MDDDGKTSWWPKTQMDGPLAHDYQMSTLKLTRGTAQTSIRVGRIFSW